MMAVTPLPGRFQGPSPCPDNTTFCSGFCYTGVQEVVEWSPDATFCDGLGWQLPLPTTQPEIQCLIDLVLSVDAANIFDDVLTGYINKETTFETPDGSVVAPADLIGADGS